MMRNRRILSIAVCAFVFVSYPAAAKELSLAEVLDSSNVHYPKIKSAIAKQDAASAKTQEAQGAFDLRIDGDAKLRASGYYDGDYVGGQLVKPLSPMNAEVYTGYRNGRGDFPVYNDDLRTKDGGEVTVGLVFSLLRNREIDDRRFKLRDASLEKDTAAVDLMLTRLSAQMKAVHAYAEWLASGNILRVYADLLQLAEERQRNLLSRIKAGDAARIQATENEQNLVKRKAMLNEAKRDFVKRSNELSLFLRDAAGNPRVPGEEELPENFPKESVPQELLVEADIKRVIETRPEIKALKINMQQQRNQLLMGDNSLLPKVDLGIEVSRDQGGGPKQLDETETIGLIKFSIPLQTNLGEGRSAAAKAQLRKLHSDSRLVADSIRAELYSLAADLRMNEENLKLSDQEVSLAEKMESAERKLLAGGASNIFLVNSREEKAAEARVKNILSNMYFLKSVGSYNAATMKFDKLSIAAVDDAGVAELR